MKIPEEIQQSLRIAVRGPRPAQDYTQGGARSGDAAFCASQGRDAQNPKNLYEILRDLNENPKDL